MKRTLTAVLAFLVLSGSAIAGSRDEPKKDRLPASAGYQVPGCVDYYLSDEKGKEGKVVQICNPRSPKGQPAKTFWDTVLSIGGGSD